MATANEIEALKLVLAGETISPEELGAIEDKEFSRPIIENLVELEVSRGEAELVAQYLSIFPEDEELRTKLIELVANREFRGWTPFNDRVKWIHSVFQQLEDRTVRRAFYLRLNQHFVKGEFLTKEEFRELASVEPESVYYYLQAYGFDAGLVKHYFQSENPTISEIPSSQRLEAMELVTDAIIAEKLLKNSKDDQKELLSELPHLTRKTVYFILNETISMDEYIELYDAIEENPHGGEELLKELEQVGQEATATPGRPSIELVTRVKNMRARVRRHPEETPRLRELELEALAYEAPFRQRKTRCERRSQPKKPVSPRTPSR